MFSWLYCAFSSGSIKNQIARFCLQKHGDNNCIRPSTALSWLLALVCSMAQASAVVDLNPAKQPVALSTAAHYWVDRQAQMTPEQIFSNPGIA